MRNNPNAPISQAVSGLGSPGDIIGYDDYGDPITELDAATIAEGMATGGRLTAAQAETVAAAQIATNYGATLSSSGDTITLPFLTAAQQNQLLQQLGQRAGNWIARQVGGSTVLYKQNSGIGTLDIKSLLLPAALILGFMAISKQK
jgi:hypothetical protein